MHDHNLNSKDNSNPCVQIMLNIHSKNIVNNNILTERQKQSKVDNSQISIPEKHEKSFVLPKKKTPNQSTNKNAKSILNKTTITLIKGQDNVYFENAKSKKKNLKASKNNLSANQSQKSNKNVGLKKNGPQFFNKTLLSDDACFSACKSAPRLKAKPKVNRQARQKIVELMIKDYQKGRISAQNFKVAVSSLIQRQTIQTNINPRIPSRRQKSRTPIPSSNRSSGPNSLRNTPKNIPAKSKSQKFYQQSFLQRNKVLEQLEKQPEIMERVIERKDFVNKIVIKGINSSLFLSNQWIPEEQCQQKRKQVFINVINTSDSVKDLRKQMQRSLKKNEFNLELLENLTQKEQNNYNHQHTNNILKDYLQSLQYNSNLYGSKNSSDYQDLSLFNKNTKEFYSREKKLNVSKDDQYFDQFHIREDLDPEEVDYLKTERQNHTVVIQSEQDPSCEISLIKGEETSQQSNNHNPSNAQFQQKIRSYLSSELEKRGQSLLAMSVAQKQSRNQKRAKSITLTEIKKFNSVLDTIKLQLNKNFSSKNTIEEQEIFSKIVALIESEKSKVENELKIYNPFHERKLESKSNSEKEEKNEQNQIINSFKKKLKKIDFFKNETIPQEESSNQKIHYDSFDDKSLSSSQKSLASSVCSNHFQKTKIAELNLDQIEMGLRKRLNEIELKKQQQISLITEKFINDKITPKQYQEEKQIIEKWFSTESQKLKKTKKNLIQGYRKAKDYLAKDEIKYETKLTREKSNKMIKCISQKYLNQQVSNNQESFASSRDQTSVFQSDSEKSSVTEGQKTPVKQIDELLEGITFSRGFKQKITQSSQKFNSFSDLVGGGNKQLSKQLKRQVYVQNKTQHQEKKLLIQPSVGKIQSQISAFLQRYQKQNHSSSQSDHTDEANGNRTQTESDESFEHVQNEQKDLDFRRTSNQNVIFSPNYQLSEHEKEINSQFSVTQQKESPQTYSHPNIVVNKQGPTAHDHLFSPKKPGVSEQFSEELQQYNSFQKEKQQFSSKKVNLIFNQVSFRFKCLTEQDKDDIFEFMFLDLCLEIFLQQTKHNRIMKSIEKYISYLKRKKKIPKGFKTGLQECKNYIAKIQPFLQQQYLQTLKRLQFPMGPSAKEMLKYMRDYDDISDKDSETDTVNLVLPTQIYEKFELEPINKLQVEKYYEDEERQESRIKFLKSLKHFHHKALFDALNEMLDFQRNYGIWGKPFPWKKRISIDRQLTDEELKIKLKKSSQRVVESCLYFCGVLVDKEDSVFGKTTISDEYLQHIREDRMSKMLSSDMMDSEDRWIFYDDEETEVLVSVSKMITGILLAEATKQIKALWK